LEFFLPSSYLVHDGYGVNVNTEEAAGAISGKTGSQRTDC